MDQPSEQQLRAAALDALKRKIEPDTERLAAALMSDDPMTVVIPAHLHIEQCVNDILRVIGPNDALLKLKLAFGRKIELLIDWGAIDPQVKRPLELLSNYRNRLAHELGGTVSDADMSALHEAFAEHHFEAMTAAYQSTQTKVPGATVSALSEQPAKNLFALAVLTLRGYLLSRQLELALKPSAALAESPTP